MTLTLLFDILHTQVAVIQYASISFCQNSILFCTTFFGEAPNNILFSQKFQVKNIKKVFLNTENNRKI